MHAKKKETQIHSPAPAVTTSERPASEKPTLEKPVMESAVLEENVLRRLRNLPGMYSAYEALEENWRQRFMEFCTGKKTLPLTYDPFFKKIFHPDIHPERLSRFLSAILGQEVQALHILPTAETLPDGGALLIMDILVGLADGSLANVEIQKIPYLFPGQRMSCYSSDLVMRQYSRVKGKKGRLFKYNDLKPVYTIVIYEKSSGEFHRHPQSYVHHGKTAFDTGLSMDLLQEYWLIALDVFRERRYHEEKSELAGWLSLLATEDVEDAGRLAEEYPWLTEIYQEMEEYLHKPEEALDMFSEALKILDRNTVQYMIELQQEQLAQKDEQLAQQKEQLTRQKAEIERLTRMLETVQK